MVVVFFSFLVCSVPVFSQETVTVQGDYLDNVHNVAFNRTIVELN